MIELSDKLSELRLQKDLSLQEVADATNISKTHIWELEKGISHNPKIDTLKTLADNYNVSVTYLIGEKSHNDEFHQILIQSKKLSDTSKNIIKGCIESALKAEGYKK